MKQSILHFAIAVISINSTQAQAEDHNTPVIDKEVLKEQKEVIKKVEKQEKKTEKEVKERKKTEKKRKQEENLHDAIKSKKRNISKNEKKVIGLQDKLKTGSEKGKLSLLDIEKMISKIEKLKKVVQKDNEKLAKLMKRR